MNNLLKVALLQLKPPQDQAEAQAKGTSYCIEAAKQGADIIVFPELWNIGYHFPNAHNLREINYWKKKAVTPKSEFVKGFAKLAKSLKVAIAITYLENCGEGRPKNSLTLFDRHGNTCLHYSKVHTCDFGDEIVTAPGTQFKTATLDTTAGGIQIGAMICFDREQPESARLLMLQGAELILVPNASNLRRAQLQQFSTRAFENMVGVAMANYATPKNNGHSCAFSPVVENENQQEIENCLVMANGKEGIYYAEFNMQQIRKWRKTQIWGNTYRKPSAYYNETTITSGGRERT